MIIDLLSELADYIDMKINENNGKYDHYSNTELWSKNDDLVNDIEQYLNNIIDARIEERLKKKNDEQENT